MNTKKSYVMRALQGTAAALMLCSVVTTPAFAQSQQRSGSEMDQGSAALMKSMEESDKKMKSMTMKGKTDQDFAEMMRMHHQAGIEMAQIEMKHGKDPAMKKMAEKIIVSQKKETKEFDQWLQKQK